MVVPLFMAFAIGIPAHAQMMGGMNNKVMGTTTANTGSKTISEEEAEGKAVWDKLQSKQVTCKDLKDEDFDVLADFFMGNMMGANHEAMNTMMADRLGEEGEEQMHIAMGKRLSGCDTGAALPKGAEYFSPMMGDHMGGGFSGDARKGSDDNWGMMGGRGHSGMMGGGFGSVFGGLTWLLGLAFLASGTAFFWKGMNKQG